MVEVMYEKDGEMFPQTHSLAFSIFQVFRWPIFQMTLQILLMKTPVVLEKCVLQFKKK